MIHAEVIVTDEPTSYIHGVQLNTRNLRLVNKETGVDLTSEEVMREFANDNITGIKVMARVSKLTEAPILFATVKFIGHGAVVLDDKGQEYTLTLERYHELYELD